MEQASRNQERQPSDYGKEKVYESNHDEIELIDLIRIIWKYRWFLIMTPVIVGVLVYAFSFLLPPTYESSAQILLTNVDDPLYSNPENVKALLLSRDRLLPLMEEFKLPYQTVASFRKALTVESSEKLLTVQMKYSDPKVAQAVINRLLEPVLEESHKVYLEKRGLVESMRASLVSLQQETQESLNRNKATLTAIETQSGLTDVEKDISRARLLDYIVRDEYSLKDYISRIQEIDQRLLNLKEAELIEKPTLPRYPIAPRKGMNAILGFFASFMLALVIIFIREYWLQHRDEFYNKDKQQGTFHKDDSGMPLEG
ncbi:MAG: lipopolysaccharide biosynthesis [Candidatus Carbobacillus altaicus]|uniref:Lipopolysaccharide biosynthesis n=1 Tax=Candidatus Carbonibacillus altaicus TaxID=2163959 RepID=A0A2R6Y3P7_9BACL|nr:MAG: lipopolysaccharide biosynthesis [Candidatus Carbobacillus altaicus]